MGHIYLSVDKPKLNNTNLRLQIDNVADECYDSMLAPSSLLSLEANALYVDHRLVSKNYGSLGFLTVNPVPEEPTFHEFVAGWSEEKDKASFVAHLRFHQACVVLSPEVSIRPVALAHYTGSKVEKENTVQFYQYDLASEQHQIVELTTHCRNLRFLAVNEGKKGINQIDAIAWRNTFEKSDMEVTVTSSIAKGGRQPHDYFKKMFKYSPAMLNPKQAQLIATFKGTH